MTNAIRWGATPDEWDHFDLVLGLGADLLPVVSKQGARISPDSKLKALGKTPSIYNRQGLVAGLPGWSQQQATSAELTRWASEPDYGICLQTRSWRALDVDVPDRALAREISDAIEAHLSRVLPTRYRQDSGKVLHVFRLAGEFSKRAFDVAGGLVEFLANGQQFIAVGTHPGGARYEWAGGLPLDAPELTVEEFNDLWDSLVLQFAVSAPAATNLTLRKRGETVAVADPVADYLQSAGLVLGEDREGALMVACPWEGEHTTGEAGDGSTVWFPAGTRGYAQGHFKCLHGHCAHRADGDFFAAVGYVEDVLDGFEVLPVETSGPAPLPLFKRDKNGRIESTIENVVAACRCVAFCGVEIRFDTFRDEIMFTPAGGSQWQAFKDSDYSRLRIALERKGFKPIGRELVRDVVLLVADEAPFDSAQAWLNGLPWDGVKRVEGFLSSYFMSEDTEYTRAVSVYLWTALAGRVLDPGCKADMVPILVGAQGAGKSSAVAAMAPAPEFFCEVSFHEKDEDLARKMRGRLVAELGELRGLHTRELESIKAFITRTHENWIPKYREFAVQFPRRLVFIGTTNKDEFLADETGNRRWLPVRVEGVRVDAIRQDRSQLWAEARVLFKKWGILYKNAEGLAGEAHEEHTIEDAWLSVVQHWLVEPDALTGDTPRAREFLRVSDVLKSALRFDDKNITRREEMRVGAILRTLGYARKKLRTGEVTSWVYVPTCSYLFPPLT